MLTQPWFGTLLFGVGDAVRALASDFDAYGTSPHFVADWRWYKDIAGDERRYNERAVAAYETNALNLLDCRTTFAPHDGAFGRRLRAATDRFYEALMSSEVAGNAHHAGSFVPLVLAVADLIGEHAPHTAAAVRELGAQLDGTTLGADHAANFASWFGRGSQYVSFIRR